VGPKAVTRQGIGFWVSPIILKRVKVDSRADFPELAYRNRAIAALAHVLYGWKDQRHQDSDNGKDHNELEERKSTACSGGHNKEIDSYLTERVEASHFCL
jgi:hypothetical protein